jgi:lipopolysaccharide export system permease protein
MRRLNRYVLGELFGPFAFSVGIFVALFLGTNVLSDVMRWSTTYQVSPLLVARLVIYRLPWILGFVFPMAMLLAALLCFSRLSNDSEIVAMLAGGVSFRRLVAPVLAAGVVVSVLTLLINETIGPSGQRAETGLITAMRGGTAGARRDVALVERQSGGVQLLIAAEEFHLGRRELKNVKVLVCRHWESRILVEAARAVWQEKEWRLYDGRTWLDLDRDTGSVQPIDSETFEVTLGTQRVKLDKTPEEIARDTAKTYELTAAELRRRIIDKQARGADWRREITPDLVELHSKYAQPWTCLLFALIGAPLGVRPQRSSKGLAYGICLVIIFAYFVLWRLLELFGKSGFIPPALAAWTPNLVLALVGAFLLRATGR